MANLVVGPFLGPVGIGGPDRLREYLEGSHFRVEPWNPDLRLACVEEVAPVDPRRDKLRRHDPGLWLREWIPVVVPCRLVCLPA